ncbi:patatin-like phospholipase family protein [Nonlabens sp. Asnod3-H03]|uniref:patatin-like phospholipase family protein n=1 Tax=Nonlabens sp. Asnod3-H03 TaxID=3160580 RepID=UPI00386AFF13
MGKFKVQKVVTVSGKGTFAVGKLVEESLNVGDNVFIYSDSTLVTNSSITAIEDGDIPLTSIDSSYIDKELKILLRGVDFNILKSGMIILTALIQVVTPDIDVILDDGLKGYVTGRVDGVKHNKDTRFADLFKSKLWNAPGKNLGVSLQGGGLKGSFGVGAIHFLVRNKTITDTKQLFLSSASTGSITSLILAENSDSEISEKALNQYLNLFNVSDMFEIRKEVRRILKKSKILENIVKQAITTGTYTPDISKIVTNSNIAVTIMTEISSKVLPDVLYDLDKKITGLFMDMADIDTENLKKVAKLLKELSKIKYSLATLDPVKESLNDSRFGINVDKIQKANTKLWMAVTSYNTTVTAYITEEGKILYPKQMETAGSYDYTNYEVFKIERITDPENSFSGLYSKNNLKEFLINGALASGAFPMFFPPMRITYFTGIGSETKTELFIDGGIRENLPLKILTHPNMRKNDTTKLNNVIAIYCSNIKNSINTDTEITWVDTIGATASATLSEINRTDISYGKSLNVEGLEQDEQSDTNVLHIYPLVPTVGLTEVVPFMVKASIWYGYMRAYDESYITQQKPIMSKRTELRYNSSEIYILFKLLYAKSENLLRTCGYFIDTGKQKTWVSFKGLKNNYTIQTIGFNIEAFEEYLKVKIQIMELIIERKELNKEKGVPDMCVMDGEKGFMRKEFYTDWMGVYEFLDSYNIAINKKNRLKENFNRLYLSSEKNYEVGVEASPAVVGYLYIITGRINDQAPQIKVLIERIENNLKEFEGNRQTIDQMFFTVNNNNRMNEKFIENSGFFTKY